MSDMPISLLGYKAVSAVHGNELLKSGVFHVTVSDEIKEHYHWLGNGIYFYPVKADAESWANNMKGSEAFVVSAETIKLLSYEIYDFGDCMDNWWELKREESRKAIESLRLDIGGIEKIPPLFEYRHKYAENIWNNNPAVKVCMAKFPSKPLSECPKVNGLDIRYRRKEFCVRKNKYIIAASIKRCG